MKPKSLPKPKALPQKTGKVAKSGFKDKSIKKSLSTVTTIPGKQLDITGLTFTSSNMLLSVGYM